MNASKCPHILVIGDYTKEDIIAKQNAPCDSCKAEGPYLWVCLHRQCLYVGCTGNNHCLKHFTKCKEHSIFLNLTSLRVYCLLCECEVFLENNEPPLPGMLPTHSTKSDSDEDADGSSENLKPRGLTGLQNLGNTCYMNSAIQALSNCPQLTNFFLECGSFVRSEKKSGLSNSYMRLMKEMWHKKRPSYVVPSGVAYGIKIVCPVFRGYAQQDAQEFLRCFMDQLHEELKEAVVEISASPDDDFDTTLEDSGMPGSDDSSEYETCDSSSFADEGVFSEEYKNPPPLRLDSFSRNIQLMDDSFLSPKSANQLESGDLSALLICDSNDDQNKFSKNDASDISFDCVKIEDAQPNSSSNTDSGNTSVVSQNNQNNDSFKKSFSGSSKGKHMTSIISSIINFKRRKCRQYRSIISDTFDGKILSSVQCLTCDTISTTRETFQDVSLPIPNGDHLHKIHASHGSHQASGQQSWFSSIFGWVMSWFWGPSVSLQDCLAAFFSADELKEDNMYSCEKCKKLRNGIKYSKVIELPEVLCIHLKRFRHEIMFSSKISSYVSFPLEGLDMSPFLHKSYPHSCATYDLISVICHHGTAGSGHYTSYCLNYLNEQWYEFDDQYVTAVDAEMIRHCEAYVLFYRKSAEDMIKKRQCAVELMERSRSETGLLKFHISKQWINKFNNFAEPGPITNTDFLCIHGGVPPQKATFADELCTALPQAVWEYLHDTFGGGPPCTHLYICPICQTEQDNRNQKRRKELDEFTTMNVEFQRMEDPVVYAISMSWFKTWENFVCKDQEQPGPIDNSSICYVKSNQAILKLGSDYCSVSKEMYFYLQNIYGGGPDITVRTPSKNTLPSHDLNNCKNIVCYTEQKLKLPH